MKRIEVIINSMEHIHVLTGDAEVALDAAGGLEGPTTGSP
jgi:hypothetical protein